MFHLDRNWKQLIPWISISTAPRSLGYATVPVDRVQSPPITSVLQVNRPSYELPFPYLDDVDLLDWVRVVPTYRLSLGLRDWELPLLLFHRNVLNIPSVP